MNDEKIFQTMQRELCKAGYAERISFLAIARNDIDFNVLLFPGLS